MPVVKDGWLCQKMRPKSVKFLSCPFEIQPPKMNEERGNAFNISFTGDGFHILVTCSYYERVLSLLNTTKKYLGVKVIAMLIVHKKLQTMLDFATLK